MDIKKIIVIVLMVLLAACSTKTEIKRITLDGKEGVIIKDLQTDKIHVLPALIEITNDKILPFYYFQISDKNFYPVIYKFGCAPCVRFIVPLER